MVYSGVYYADGLKTGANLRFFSWPYNGGKK